MEGLFSLSLAEGSAPLGKPQCGACNLFRTCKSPKMQVAGRGKIGLLIVGEAPGEEEDARNRPFVGKSGQRLRQALAEAGVHDMEKDCWIANALRCRPPGNVIKDERAVEHCRPLTVDALKEYKPNAVLLLGKSAVRSVIGWTLGSEPGGIEQWVGWTVPDQKTNAWLVPTYHPAYLGYQEDQPTGPMLARAFDRHVRTVVGLARQGPPWTTVPDYKREVKVLHSPSEAAVLIDRLTELSTPVAFDFETDRIKPDHPDARLVCASMSDGDTTFAFPWHGEAVRAFKRFARSDVPKVAQNLKMEARWTKAVLGVTVRNWMWDTLQVSHILDNRPGVNGLDFQAYVRLGYPDWSKGVSRYLTSRDKGGNSPNRVKDCSLTDLMVYNGVDSLVTMLIAREQARLLGFNRNFVKERSRA